MEGNRSPHNPLHRRIPGPDVQPYFADVPVEFTPLKLNKTCAECPAPTQRRSQPVTLSMVRSRDLSPLSSLLVLLAGCGGGGGATPVTVPLSPKVRILQKGDTASYAFAGTFTATGKPSAPVSGSTVHTISDKVGDVLTVVHDLHIVIDGSPFDLH